VTVWFTSDPHWGHSWVAHLRGFGNGGPQDREAHDATLLENFQSMVKPGDQVWWLGDLSMGRPEYALEMTSLITGHHHLILGNHDEANPLFRDSYKHQRRYMEVFESVQTHARRRVNGHEVLREAQAMGIRLPVGDPLIERLINLTTIVGVQTYGLTAPSTWVPVKLEDA
jgi:calcineurin-like phosphoesterase family protein